MDPPLLPNDVKRKLQAFVPSNTKIVELDAGGYQISADLQQHLVQGNKWNEVVFCHHPS
jgi:hypothetical protein